MTAEHRSQHDSPQPRRRWQFSLRWMVICVFALCIVLAIAAQFPRQSSFAVFMMLLLLFPLVVVALLRALLARLGLEDPARQCLGLWPPAKAPSLGAGLTTAILSMITLVGLWPLVREIGITLSLLAWQPIANYTYTWADAGRSMSEAFYSGGYWLRLWKWEAWSVGRWWLLFGVILFAWLAASAPWRRWLKAEPVPATLARFLAFAPWLIVLEFAFLIGVWIGSPSTVPEPSTGFVVGIFSWDLWHWNCWRDREWLIRGALPTLVAGTVFFAGVLRWRWPVAVVAALILIPIALMLSVACTVAYQNGFPKLL
ncbi:MAG: hypothetical protein L0211_16270 [Planctomycetaceae bacterium]|nr:hypothetical protein [Planctomycetaceae bacterium]